ncbi:molybdenum cofactor guanylyltransferase MobA [Nostoc sp. NIES-2111]
MGVAKCEQIAGVVLAGGQSRRMGWDKAGVLLADRPLVVHALDLLRPQVGALAVNANAPLPEGTPPGTVVLPDARPGFTGPLAGIETALAFGQSTGALLVATVPVDAPFLPPGLVARLAAGLSPGDMAAVAATEEGPHPVAAVWRVDALSTVSLALDEGLRAVRDLLARIPHRVIRFEDTGAFTNVNTPEDLARAEERMRR